jgi:hypothetical protein
VGVIYQDDSMGICNIFISVLILYGILTGLLDFNWPANIFFNLIFSSILVTSILNVFFLSKINHQKLFSRYIKSWRLLWVGLIVSAVGVMLSLTQFGECSWGSCEDEIVNKLFFVVIMLGASLILSSFLVTIKRIFKYITSN